MGLYQHILFASDLTSRDDKLIKKASELAKTFGAKLSVIHCIEPMPTYGSFRVESVIEDIEKEWIENTRKEVENLISVSGVEIHEQIIQIGQTKRLITEAAVEHNVDLILVGSHGRHGLAELSKLIGSTANAVNSHAKCDVLTIHMEQEQD